MLYLFSRRGSGGALVAGGSVSRGPLSAIRGKGAAEATTPHQRRHLGPVHLEAKDICIRAESQTPRPTREYTKKKSYLNVICMRSDLSKKRYRLESPMPTVR